MDQDTGESPYGSNPITVRVYGRSAALAFSAGECSKGHTVIVDAAAAVDGGRYDWSNKIRVMLKPKELVIALVVLVGDSPRAFFTHHGPAEDKFVEMHHQVTQVKFTVEQRDTLHTVGIESEDIFDVVALFTAQVKRNAPSAVRDDVLHLVRATTGKMRRAMWQVVGNMPSNSQEEKPASHADSTPQSVSQLLKMGKPLPAKLKADLAWKVYQPQEGNPDPTA